MTFMLIAFNNISLSVLFNIFSHSQYINDDTVTTKGKTEQSKTRNKLLIHIIKFS